jgi:hypothetical protein
MADNVSGSRNVVFISKATPGDDEFVLWLGPRLEAAGYTVYADILRLDPGTRWRKELTDTLQNKAIKMLLCCRDSSLSRNGVQEEIGIAEDLVRELSDPKFIVPLRLEPFKKVFGIGELQWVDFTEGWASGLSKLLGALGKANVPRNTVAIQISPNWELYRKRNSIQVKHEPEPLTSNWLRISEIPDAIKSFTPKGAIDHGLFARACERFKYHARAHERGFFTFASPTDVQAELGHFGAFEQLHEVATEEFVESGIATRNLKPREASNMVHTIFRRAWETRAAEIGLLRFDYSNSTAYHVSGSQARVGQRFSWGTQGEKRSSMLRNVAKGHVWQFGVTAIPSLWPYYHFKLKSRVLFSEWNGESAGEVLDKASKQHRLRRSVCKGWRNPQWHGRLRAFLELLAGEAPFINLPVGSEIQVKLETIPIFFTSPVTTDLPTSVDDEMEEEDGSTITIGLEDYEEEDE